MFNEFKELLSIFNARGVRYLVVGGYAVSLHAQPRSTQDIDILIACDTENARAVYQALEEFGAPLEGFAPAISQSITSFFAWDARLSQSTSCQRLMVSISSMRGRIASKPWLTHKADSMRSLFRARI